MDIGTFDYYYDDYNNEMILRRVAENCYLPANKMLLELISKYQGQFKVSFSISGTAIDQFKIYAPEVIESFQKLAKTGCVEFLAETDSHSLSGLKNKTEFKRQVESHSATIESLFGKRPTAFANTELIYSDEIGTMVSEMGYRTVLTESSDQIPKWKSPYYTYYSATDPALTVLLKNNQLSDDIAFRFSDSNWSGWPLTAQKYVSWLKKIPKKEKLVNLFMNYETFGEHHKFGTGIFKFLDSLPSTVLRKSDFKFITPSEVLEHYKPISMLQEPSPISVADEKKSLTTWLGNELQKAAFEKLYRLSGIIAQCEDPVILKDWKYLQTSDHFYYMSTKYFSDGNFHSIYNPYDNPYQAFVNYMNVLNDFSIRVCTARKIKRTDQIIIH